ncbi:MBL fold metallo-hydrolase [Bacillaceae bacterium Marseille-Q3522]|nr:MBL fold metallo-hydrolase [Bacillaceae bacterium Marseille-Q3522]
MKISVLGGGSEVGASCLHIEIAGTNLLIDAGMRMHSENLLPALGMVENLGNPEVVLVTHAHADHIGALPIVHSLFPAVPIYATPPTADLMKIMMKDSYKIMEQRCRETNTLPPFSKEQINKVLESLLLYPASGKLRIGNVRITSFRAGHILGAVMFLIEGEGETLLVTGDLSFKAGRTIPGAQVVQDIQPDVVIMESTYGNRQHVDRNTEENRLAIDVAEVVAGGGFALVPSFALGRAQEVLLILQDYMDKGLIPEFPIYVDGLVTPISRIYKQYPQYLKGPVSHRIRKHGDVFLTEGRCKAVEPKEREAVLKGKPGCIVASSGMLTGGASSWYAERLVSQDKNAIFITGYQDEESPGKKLLNVADGEENQLELNGTSYEVKCRVGKYGLSAHADANEMNRFIQSLKPTYTLLVHGDDEARNQLSGLIDNRYQPILVENGESYPFAKRKSGKGVRGKRYRDRGNAFMHSKIGTILLYEKVGEASLKLAICMGVHERTKTFVCQTLKSKLVKLRLDQVVETVDYWNRSIDELKEVADRVLTFSRPYLEHLNWQVLPERSLSLTDIFQALETDSIENKLAIALALQALPADKKVNVPGETVEYLIDEEAKEQLTNLALPIQGLAVNPALAMDIVRQLLGGHPRFIRCGVDDLGTEMERITIYFDFPDAVSEAEKKEFAEKIRLQTGWKVDFSASIRQDLLQTEITKLFGHSTGSPSIHLADRKIVLSGQKPEEAAEKLKQFQETTGFILQFNDDQGAGQTDHQPVNLIHVQPVGKKMENNEAIAEAKKWAEKRGLTIYKTGIKQSQGGKVMEVHFISPQIAKQHEADLEELSYLIGFPVTYAMNPKQNEIIRYTVEAIPGSWELKKNPSLHIDKAVVSVKLAAEPDESEENAIRKKIKNATGYTLEVI